MGVVQTFGFERFTLIVGDPTTFWFQDQPTLTSTAPGGSGTAPGNRYRKIRLSDGVTLEDFTYAGHMSQGEAIWAQKFFGPDMEDHPRFAPSPSCPIMVSGVAIEEPPEFETPPPPGSPDSPCPCPPGTRSPPSLGTPLEPPEDEPLVPWSARCGFGGVMPDGNDTVQPESWL